MPRSQPTRSAITVAGIEGVASNNRRISGSKLSIADPTAARSYLGGPDEANADATVFREIPNCLAIARPDNRSDRCNRRISAQSSTVITLLIVEEWLTIQPQHVAQYSPAGDRGENCGWIAPHLESDRTERTLVGREEPWRFAMRIVHKFVAVPMLSVGLLGLSAGTASADRPFEVFFSENITAVNPCTGDEHDITINNVVRIHEHGDREVVHVNDRTGTTSDGYVMDHGVLTIVFNGHVALQTFTDNWVDSNGSRFQVQGSFVDNLNQGELMVDRFRQRCIKP